jgi:hypothetical protein
MAMLNMCFGTPHNLAIISLPAAVYGSQEVKPCPPAGSVNHVLDLGHAPPSVAHGVWQAIRRPLVFLNICSVRQTARKAWHLNSIRPWRVCAAKARRDLSDSLQALSSFVFAHVFVPKPVPTFGRHALGDGLELYSDDHLTQCSAIPVFTYPM